MKKNMMIAAATIVLAAMATACGKSEDKKPETVGTVVGEEIVLTEPGTGADSDIIGEGTAVVVDTAQK